MLAYTLPTLLLTRIQGDDLALSGNYFPMVV